MESIIVDTKTSQAAAMPQMDAKMLASMGLDPKMLASMDPNVLKSMGIDPKMLGLDTKTSQAQASNMNDMILKSMGIDPKLLAGMDPKHLDLTRSCCQILRCLQ